MWQALRCMFVECDFCVAVYEVVPDDHDRDRESGFLGVPSSRAPMSGTESDGQDTMASVEQQVRELVDSLTPRTAHQYRLYHSKYVNWINTRIVAENTAPSPQNPYCGIPITAQLIHLFALSEYIRQPHAAGEPFKISALKKIFSSLKFLYKLCRVYDPHYAYSLDDKYLENVVRLHSCLDTDGRNPDPPQLPQPLHKISVNLWNPHTASLNDKFFKTGLEKLRFLVDFHFQHYGRLSFGERSTVSLGSLSTDRTTNALVYTFKTLSSVTEYVPDAQPHVTSYKPIALIPEENVFLCPLVSLAAYFYLRFYGVPKGYKGDGFPDLASAKQHGGDSSAGGDRDEDDGDDEEEEDDDDDEKDNHLVSNLASWQSLPVLRGKSMTKYPREETLSNYYSTAFRYCHVAYKKREYFQKPNKLPIFPDWTSDDWSDWCKVVKTFKKPHQWVAELFPSNIGLDFVLALNNRSPYKDGTDLHNDGIEISSSLLVQVFPEIEEYKRKLKSGQLTLSTNAQNFLSAMESLRNILVRSLPILYKFFPTHDIFQNSIFQRTDFQSYFLEVDQIFTANNAWSKYESMLNLLVENPLADSQASFQPQPRDLSQDVLQDLRDQNFKFVQYQTISNFQLLISSLTKVFEKLETKKSTREYIIHQLNLLEDTLRERIDKSKPSDSQVKLESPKPTTEKNGTKYKESDSDEASSTDDEGPDNDDDMQQELQFMVTELVNTKVRAALQAQTDSIFERVKEYVSETVNSKIKDEVRKQLNALLNETSRSPPSSKHERKSDHDYEVQEDGEPPGKKLKGTPVSTSSPGSVDDTKFTLIPDLDSVEAIILEWFTPNPDMNGECVHSMNKKFGKQWRSRTPELEVLYKQRKLVVEFYIYLVNTRGVDRYKAVSLCEHLKKSQPVSEFSTMLRNWKRNHNNSFEGLG